MIYDSDCITLWCAERKSSRRELGNYDDYLRRVLDRTRGGGDGDVVVLRVLLLAAPSLQRHEHNEKTAQQPQLVSPSCRRAREPSPALYEPCNGRNKASRRASRLPSSYFSTTVIVGLVLMLLMKTSLLPEIRIAVVPLPTLPTPLAGKE
jgi:hypothetical protein